MSYFQSIYTTDFKSSPRQLHIILTSNPVLSQRQIEDLSREISLPELKEAVFSFNPYKAPGPDGLHPLFYKKNLENHP